MADVAPAPRPAWTGRPSQWLIAKHWFIALAVVGVVVYGWTEREALVAALGAIKVPQPGPVLRYVAAGALALAALNLAARVIAVRSVVYRLGDGVLEVERGLLNRRTDVLELFRVRDIAAVRPVHLRLVGLGNVLLLSNDLTTPSVTIAAMRDVDGLMRALREEVNRARGRVRVTEVEGDLGR